MKDHEAARPGTKRAGHPGFSMTLPHSRKILISIAIFGCVLAAGCVTAPLVRPPLPPEPALSPSPAEQMPEPVAAKQPEPAAPVLLAEQKQEPAAEKQPEPIVPVPLPQSVGEPPQGAPAQEHPVQRAETPAPSAPPSASAELSTAPVHAREKTVKSAQEPHEGRKRDVIPIRPRKYASLAEKNDGRLLQVYVGMNKAAVEKIMGRHGFYKREICKGFNNQTYEVFFYLTRLPKKGKAITERNLTPVIFKKDRVHAIGTYKLKKIRLSAKRPYAPATASR